MDDAFYAPHDRALPEAAAGVEPAEACDTPRPEDLFREAALILGVPLALAMVSGLFLRAAGIGP